jgi:hypothetical protein
MATSKKKAVKQATKMESGGAASPSMPDPFSGMVNPMMGNMPFPAPPGVNVPPFGAPMQGGPMPPQGMMPPMPGTMPTQPSGDLFTSVGNMLRLGVDTINAALAGSNQIMQAFAGTGYHDPYGYQGHPHHYHHDWDYHHHAYCGCHHHDPACCYPSCCDCYGESCCNPSVHGC